VVIYLKDKRREMALWASKAQHAVAGFPLLFAGIHHLSDEAERPLALLEIAIAGLVLGTLVFELRAWRHHTKHGTEHHPAVGWFDLAAAAMLMFEAFHGAHTKPGYLRPPFFTAVVTLALGLSHGRLHHWQTRRRHLTVDETGLKFRISPVRRFSVQWNELSSMDFHGNRADFDYRSGRQRSLDLGRYRNAEEVRRALLEHAQANGVRIGSQQACHPAPASGSLGTNVSES